MQEHKIVIDWSRFGDGKEKEVELPEATENVQIVWEHEQAESMKLPEQPSHWCIVTDTSDPDFVRRVAVADRLLNDVIKYTDWIVLTKDQRRQKLAGKANAVLHEVFGGDWHTNPDVDLVFFEYFRLPCGLVYALPVGLETGEVVQQPLVLGWTIQENITFSPGKYQPNGEITEIGPMVSLKAFPPQYNIEGLPKLHMLGTQFKRPSETHPLGQAKTEFASKHSITPYGMRGSRRRKFSEEDLPTTTLEYSINPATKKLEGSLSTTRKASKHRDWQDKQQILFETKPCKNGTFVEWLFFSRRYRWESLIHFDHHGKITKATKQHSDSPYEVVELTDDEIRTQLGLDDFTRNPRDFQIDTTATLQEIMKNYVSEDEYEITPSPKDKIVWISSERLKR